MTPRRLPDPPNTSSIKPTEMTAAELRDAAERYWAWLDEAHAHPNPTHADQAAIERVTLALVAVTRERRRLHAEEFPMRGS